MSRTVRRLLSIVVLAALIALLVAVLTVAVFAEGVGEDDFVAYWSAARLLATGQNPYDPAALLDLQYLTRPERGQEYGRAFASWNPPWLLAILLLGLLPFDVAVRLWVLCNIVLIAAASALTWHWLTESSSMLRPLRWSLSPTDMAAGSSSVPWLWPGSTRRPTGNGPGWQMSPPPRGLPARVPRTHSGMNNLLEAGHR